MDTYSVLVSPLITEKSTMAGEAGNQVVFRVHPRATKLTIKQAVEELFDVKVKQVRTVQYLGKRRRVGRSQGLKAAWKKAYVKLGEGDRIDFFEGA